VPRIVGRRPKPRALLQGLDDSVVEKVQDLFPTSRAIEQLDEVAQAEWDVLVTTRTVDRVASHLQVVAISAPLDLMGRSTSLGQWHLAGRKIQDSPSAGWTRSVKASEFVVPDDLPPAISRLVERTLLPLVAQNESHWTLDASPRLPTTPEEHVAQFKAWLRACASRGEVEQGRHEP
jgi:hypothetical protein